MLELECCVPSALLVAVTVTVWPLGAIVVGAVYKPPLDMLPTFGFSDQVTDWFTVNCCVCDTPSDVLPGVNITGTGGVRLTVAVPSVVPSARLMANTVMDCGEVIEEGAV